MSDDLKKYISMWVWKDGLEWRFGNAVFRRRGQAVKAAEKSYRRFYK